MSAAVVNTTQYHDELALPHSTSAKTLIFTQNRGARTFTLRIHPNYCLCYCPCNYFRRQFRSPTRNHPQCHSHLRRYLRCPNFGERLVPRTRCPFPTRSRTPKTASLTRMNCRPSCCRSPLVLRGLWWVLRAPWVFRPYLRG